MYWSIGLWDVVIFITEWDPPAVGRCNLKGSLQSVGGFY